MSGGGHVPYPPKVASALDEIREMIERAKKEAHTNVNVKVPILTLCEALEKFVDGMVKGKLQP